MLDDIKNDVYDLKEKPTVTQTVPSSQDESRVFVPHEKHALVISMSSYVGMTPLPSSVNDGQKIEELLKNSGFQTTLLHDQEDPQKILDQFQEMDNIAKKTVAAKQKICFFVYYSGHGFQVNGMTAGKTISSFDLDLELKIRKLAIRPNTFVIGVLDCCREIPEIVKKGNAEQIPEKVAGQFCIVHAVGPSKSAVAVRNNVVGLSEVTGEFLNVMKNARETFPSCIQIWAKKHKTVELVDKCIYEIKFSPQAALPSSLATARPADIGEWTQDDICAWIANLNLSRDYSIFFRRENIDGAAFKTVLSGDLTWKDIGIESVGDIGKIKKMLREQKLTD